MKKHDLRFLFFGEIVVINALFKTFFLFKKYIEEDISFVKNHTKEQENKIDFDKKDKISQIQIHRTVEK